MYLGQLGVEDSSVVYSFSSSNTPALQYRSCQVLESTQNDQAGPSWGVFAVGYIKLRIAVAKGRGRGLEVNMDLAWWDLSI